MKLFFLGKAGEQGRGHTITTTKQPPTTKSSKPLYPKCDWKYCRNPGTLFPILVLPEPAWTGGKGVIEMEMDLNVCVKHANEDRLDWFLDDEGWHEIENSLAIRRLAIPKRETVRVIFRALEDRKVEL